MKKQLLMVLVGMVSAGALMADPTSNFQKKADAVELQLMRRRLAIQTRIPEIRQMLAQFQPKLMQTGMERPTDAIAKLSDLQVRTLTQRGGELAADCIAKEREYLACEIRGYSAKMNEARRLELSEKSVAALNELPATYAFGRLPAAERTKASFRLEFLIDDFKKKNAKEKGQEQTPEKYLRQQLKGQVATAHEIAEIIIKSSCSEGSRWGSVLLLKAAEEQYGTELSKEAEQMVNAAWGK
jgi:hypothetical protein